MFDMILVSVIGWTSFYGMSAGGLKTIIRFSTVIALLIGIWVMFPGLSESITNPSIKMEYYDWLQRFVQPLVPVVRFHLSDIATNTGITQFTTISRKVYLRVLYVGDMAAMFLGFWMIIYSVETIWLGSILRQSNKWAGMIMGMVAGAFIDGMIIKLLLFSSWVFQQQTIRNWIVQSVIANAWLHLLSHSFKI